MHPIRSYFAKKPHILASHPNQHLFLLHIIMLSSTTWLAQAVILGLSATIGTASPVVDARDQWATQESTLSITTYDAPNCHGNSASTNPVIYGHNHEPVHFFSFSLSRALVAGEQLDFSTYAPAPTNDGTDPACDRFVSSVWAAESGNMMNGNCGNIDNIGAACFRMWHE